MHLQRRGRQREGEVHEDLLQLHEVCRDFGKMNNVRLFECNSGLLVVNGYGHSVWSCRQDSNSAESEVSPKSVQRVHFRCVAYGSERAKNDLCDP
jgi:hypothetical protein